MRIHSLLQATGFCVLLCVGGTMAAAEGAPSPKDFNGATPAPSPSPLLFPSPTPSASPQPSASPLGPKLFARPYDFYAGTSIGYDTYSATDVNNGGQASLTTLTSGLRLGAVRTLASVEQTGELELRYLPFSSINGPRLTNLSQALFPGINWQMRFLSDSRLNWLVGANLDSTPYYSALINTTVTLTGTFSLMPFGGVRYYFNGDLFKYVDAHVGAELPLAAAGYQASMGLWQRIRIVAQLPFLQTDTRTLETWVDVVHSGEATNLETQTQLSTALWIFLKWRMDPVAAGTGATSPGPGVSR